jgi:hypothetical protein
MTDVEQLVALIRRYRGLDYIDLLRRLDRAERTLQRAVEDELDLAEKQVKREVRWHEMPAWWRKASRILPSDVESDRTDLPLPATADEAEFMEKAGFAWLSHHAPERLTPLAERLAEAERGLVRCTGCGSAWTDEELRRQRAMDPRLLSCCPERKPLNIDQWRDLAQKAEERAKAHETHIFKLEGRLDEAERMLGNLLAIVHRDGGHHTERVGLAQSASDAHQAWADLITRAERAESELLYAESVIRILEARLEGNTDPLWERVKKLEEALTGLLNRYVEMVNSGDCGHWNPEEEAPVQLARKALGALP